jgi:FkbM family methyltransferase
MNCHLILARDGQSQVCVRCRRQYPLGALPEECPRLAPSPEVQHALTLLRGRCVHRGEETGRQACPTCAGHVEIKLYACDLFGQCTLARALPGIACCTSCEEYHALAGQIPQRPLALSPCVCPLPGWCEAFLREQSPEDWQICRGMGRPPVECDRQRTQWIATLPERLSQSCLARERQFSDPNGPMFWCRKLGAASKTRLREDQVWASCGDCGQQVPAVPRVLARERIEPRSLWPSTHQFNCSQIVYQGQTLLAYRVHWQDARLALATLDEQGNVLRNDLLKLHLGDAQEDPRLFVFRDELYVSFTAYYHREGSQWTDVCYARLERDSRATAVQLPDFGAEDGRNCKSSCATGKWHVVEEFVPYYAGRQPWEKNWGFFEHEGQLYAVYSIRPHRVLRIEGNRATLVAETDVPFPAKSGLLHGGAPPVFHRGEYYCFFHRRHGATHEKAYTLDLYTFEGRPPFRPSRYVPVPLLVPSLADRPSETTPHAVFPGGAYIDARHRWCVSLGYYDQWCERVYFGINQIEACLVPLPGGPMERVAFRPGTNDLAIWKEVHDWNEYGLPDRFGADDVILDIGAHIGAFARACLARGAGYVIAVEPWPSSFALLEQNLAYYRNRAECLQIAVAGKCGRMPLRNPDTSGTSHVAVSGHFRGTLLGYADAHPLEYVLPEGRVRLMKLDCEGAEYEIIESAGALANVDEIVGEAHAIEQAGQARTMDDLAAMLRQRGYEVTSRQTSPVTWLFWAKRR